MSELMAATDAPGEPSWSPRRGRDPLGPLLWLRRLIDKARAFENRTLGEYVYPCPIDQGVLEHWGVTRDEFEQALSSLRNDEEMLAWATSRISAARIDAANSWLCVTKLENLDRQDREEGAFA